MPRKARANYFNFSGGLDTDNSPLNRKPITMTSVVNCNIGIDGSIESRRGMELIRTSLVTNTYGVNTQGTSNALDISFVDDGGTARQFQVVLSQSPSNTAAKGELQFYIGDGSNLSGTPDQVLDLGQVNMDLGGLAFDGKYIVGSGGSILYAPPTPDWSLSTVVLVEHNSTTNAWDFHTDADSFDAFHTYYRRYGTLTASKEPDTEWQAGANNLGVHPFQPGQTTWTAGSHAGSPDYMFGTSYVTNDTVKVDRGVLRITEYSEVGVSGKVGAIRKGASIRINKPSGAAYDTIREVEDKTTYYAVTLENLSDTEGIESITLSEEIRIHEREPSIVESILGRIFMVNKGAPWRIYFSQIYTDDLTNIRRFHTAVDPFNPVDNSVVSSDGGHFEINGVGTILSLKESNGSVIVFSDKGVWECVGSGGLFRADDYVVRQISSKPLVGSAAVTRMEGGLAYVSMDGVNYITKDQDSGITSTLQSLSDNKIQEYIIALPYNRLKAAKLRYNTKDKELYMLYNKYVVPGAHSMALDTSALYRNILTFKLRLGAWFITSLSDDSTYTKLSIQDIYFSEYDAGGIIPIVVLSIENAAAKQNNIFAKLTSTDEYDFMDSATYGERNLASFSSAHQTHGDLMRGKNINYIKTMYEDLGDTTTDDNGYDTPMGGCKLRASIDFANDPLEITDSFGQPFNSNVAYGKTYEIYPDDKSGFSHHMYKHKLLGRGNSIQYHFSNYLIERWWVAAQNSTGETPVSDDGTYWTETTEALYTAGGGAEWAVGTAYTTGDFVKTTKMTHFKIVGWACELIPTEGVTNY